MLVTYADFRPTSFDCAGLGLADKQAWVVVPCSRTRDSGTLAESNFHSALAMLGGESETIEVHRFGHWGPGWYEIIVAHPDRASEVEAIEAALANYPVLDDSDLSERECEAEGVAWEAYGHRDFVRFLADTYDLQDETCDLLRDCSDECFALYQDETSGTGHGSEGPHFVYRCSLYREDVAAFVRKCRVARKARKAER